MSRLRLIRFQRYNNHLLPPQLRMCGGVHLMSRLTRGGPQPAGKQVLGQDTLPRTAGPNPAHQGKRAVVQELLVQRAEQAPAVPPGVRGSGRGPSQAALPASCVDGATASLSSFLFSSRINGWWGDLLPNLGTTRDADTKPFPDALGWIGFCKLEVVGVPGHSCSFAPRNIVEIHSALVRAAGWNSTTPAKTQNSLTPGRRAASWPLHRVQPAPGCSIPGCLLLAGVPEPLFTDGPLQRSTHESQRSNWGGTGRVGWRTAGTNCRQVGDMGVGRD